MNRRNFLAIIPAISSIPIIGKAYEQDKEKIVIYQPEDIKQSIDVGVGKDSTRISILVVDKHGKVLAVGKDFSCDYRPIYWEQLGHVPMVMREEIALSARLTLIEDVPYSEILKTKYKL